MYEIVSISNGRRGKYKGLEIVLKELNSRNTETHFLFDRGEAIMSFKTAGLQEGDWADIRFEQRGRFNNPVEFMKVSPPNGQERTRYQPQNETMKDDHPDKVARINRSVALKAGMDGAHALMGAGVVSIKKNDPTSYVALVLDLAREFDAYLTAGGVSVTGEDDLEQESFNEHYE